MDDIKPERVSSRDPTQVPESVYSPGTAFAIDTIEEMILEGKFDNSNLAINMATILRNHIDKDIAKFDTVVELFKREMGMMIQEITGMLSRHSKNTKHRILFYIIDYDTVLPESVRRPSIPSRDLLRDVIKYVIAKQNVLFAQKHGEVNGVAINFMTNNMRILPHIVLKNYFQINSGYQDLVMISHVPMDFHIQKYLRKFAIIETHTGKYKLPKELGMKVFKHEHMPFCPVLHALLGDKDYIQSLLSIKQKKELYALGEKEHWEVAPINKIRDGVNSLHFIPPVNFE